MVSPQLAHLFSQALEWFFAGGLGSGVIRLLRDVIRFGPSWMEQRRKCREFELHRDEIGLPSRKLAKRIKAMNKKAQKATKAPQGPPRLGGLAKTLRRLPRRKGASGTDRR